MHVLAEVGAPSQLLAGEDVFHRQVLLQRFLVEFRLEATVRRSADINQQVDVVGFQRRQKISERQTAMADGEDLHNVGFRCAFLPNVRKPTLTVFE